MLQVIKETRDNILLVKFAGSIEESVDFNALIGEVSTKKMDVILKEVARINSIGVKAWIKYFQSIATIGVEIRFLECSTAIVEQINLISNFTCGGHVESIYVPFCCVSCNTELLGLFKTKDLKAIQCQLPKLKCTKCGGVAQFDDIPEEYFSFLKRTTNGQ